MCLLFFCPSLFPLFISAFSLSFLALFSHPLPLPTLSLHLLPPLPLPASQWHSLLI